MRKIKTLKKNYEFKNVLSKGKFFIGKQVSIYVLKNKKKCNAIEIIIAKNNDGHCETVEVEEIV